MNTYQQGNAIRSKRLSYIMRRLGQSWQLYVMLLLPLIALIIFSYWPMYGILLAFKKYRVKLGIWGSPWVGMMYFKQFFNSPMFGSLISNTFQVSIYSMLAGFPFPILLGLMLNEVGNLRLKKSIQTITFAPYFLSTVIVVGMLLQLFGWSGIINTLLQPFGVPRTDYLASPTAFRHLYVWSGVWQGSGYSAVLYIAALAGIDPELYDAAKLDGASRVQKIRHIDIPGIMPIIIITLIMNAGGILSVGYEKIYLLQNNINIGLSEVISTYVYKMGLQNAQYSFGTAVGLFNSLISLVMITLVNWIARKVGETSLW